MARELYTNLIAPSIYELVPVMLTIPSISHTYARTSSVCRMCGTCGWSLAKKTKLLPRWISIVHFCSFTPTIIFYKRFCTQCDGYSASFMWYDCDCCYCCQRQYIDNRIHNNRLNQFARTTKTTLTTTTASRVEKKMEALCHVIYFTSNFLQPFKLAKSTALPTQTGHLICTFLFTFNYDAIQ